MSTAIARLSQLLALVGLVALVLGLILDLSGKEYWLAYPAGWFSFAAACGILAIAGKICWPGSE